MGLRSDDPERRARLACSVAAAGASVVDDPLDADVVLLDGAMPTLAHELRALMWPAGGAPPPRCVVVTDSPLSGAALVDLLAAGLSGTIRWDVAADELRALLTELVAAGGPEGATRRPPSRDDERAALEDVLATRGFEILLQPIAELRGGHVIAVEALARFGGEDPRPPQAWLDLASRVEMRVELELALAAAALDTLAAVSAPTLLCINVGAATLQDQRLAELLATVDARRVVLELTEHHDITDYEALGEAAAALSAQGVRISVDDSGAGVHSLARIALLHPSYLKIDRAIVSDLDTDPARIALARALIGFAAEVGAEVIAEGLETAAEAACLRELGARYGQGYLIAAPGSPQTVSPGPYGVLGAEQPDEAPAVIHAFALPRRAEGDFHAAVHAVLGFLEGELPGDSYFVSQLDFAARRSGVIAVGGPGASVIRPGMFFPIAEVPEYWMSRGDGPRLCPDVGSDPVYGGLAITQHPGFGALIAVPLELADGTRFGAISVASPRRNAFDRRDLAMLHGLAELLGRSVAEETADMHPLEVARYLRQLAQTDPVTKTLNGAGFREGLQATLSRPGPAGTHRFLVRLRIVDFGSVVERFGRAVGDLVLRDTAAALQSAARPMDLVGRIADDELAMVLTGRDERHDLDVVLQATAARLADGPRRREVTPSLDVGATELDGTRDPDDALRRAEAVMAPFAGGHAALLDGLL